MRDVSSILQGALKKKKLITTRTEKIIKVSLFVYTLLTVKRKLAKFYYLVCGHQSFYLFYDFFVK